MEELEETAKLALLLRGHHPLALTDDQIGALVRKFDLEWD
jgi:3-dehydro-4-phosphotetronate decarboxylase